MLSTVYHIQSQALRPYVQYILFNQSAALSHPQRITSLPNNNFCLGVINQGELYEQDGEMRIRAKEGVGSYLSGLYTRPHVFCFTDKLDEICIDFTLAGYQRFFAAPASIYYLSEDVLGYNLGHQAIAFFEYLFTLDDLYVRGQGIEQFLLFHLRQNQKEVPGYFHVLENEIGHLIIRRFWGDEFKAVFDSIFPLLQHTKGLVVDVRVNDGGNSDNSVYVMQHLSHKPFYTSNWSTPVYNAAFNSWNMEQEWYSEPGALMEPDGNIEPYNKPIILLIGPRTYSAGEDFCSYYQQSGIGPMMGALTAGSTGNPTGINLVKDVWAQVCTKRDVFYDGTEFVGYGVKPDIAVEHTVEDYLKDYDTVLEAAKQYLRSKF